MSTRASNSRSFGSGSTRKPMQDSGTDFKRAQICLQFKRGKCYYGVNCKFVHDDGTRDGRNILGSEGLAMRIRERPHSGFGGAQNFDGNLALHRENDAITLVDPRENYERISSYYAGKNTEETVALKRENDAITLVNLQAPMKKRPCYNWQRTGSCPFGVHCKFAHGEAETKMLCSVPLQDSGKALAAAGTNADATEGATSTKKGFKIAYEQLENGRKRLIWWTDVKQVNGIYADWIDSV